MSDERHVQHEDVLRRASYRAGLIAALVVFGIEACAVAAELPGGLYSPDHGVVCNRGRGVCFDRYGPSIGLTEAFLGKDAAHALTSALRGGRPGYGPDAQFSPGDNIACVRKTGPCRVGGVVHDALTAVLYGPRPAKSGQ